MRLPIKQLKQKTADDCSETCLRMICAYFSEAFSDEAFDAFVKKDSEGGVALTELGSYAVSRGFTVDAYAYNLSITDPQLDTTRSSQALITKLEILKGSLSSRETFLGPTTYNNYLDEWYRYVIESTIRALETGVNYKIARPSLTGMKKLLDNETPIIITVNFAALRGIQGNPLIGHDILINGYEDDGKILFIDPESGTQESIDEDSFMFALLQRKIISASAYMLAIKK